MNAQQRAVGRIWHIDQQKNVRWTFLYGEDTMDGYLCARSIDKYATSIAAEVDLDARIMARPEVANKCAQ